MSIFILIGSNKDKVLRMIVNSMPTYFMIPNFNPAPVGPASAAECLTRFRDLLDHVSNSDELLKVEPKVSRHLYITTDNPGVLDAAFLEEIMLCDVEVGMMLTDHSEFKRFKSAYNAGIQHISELLRSHALWR